VYSKERTANVHGKDFHRKLAAESRKREQV